MVDSQIVVFGMLFYVSSERKARNAKLHLIPGAGFGVEQQHVILAESLATNHRFGFHKSSQLVIRPHNETLPVALPSRP